jgi:hypothetical protein
MADVKFQYADPAHYPPVTPVGTDAILIRRADGSTSSVLISSLSIGGSDRSTVTALAIASGVVAINAALGDYFSLSLTANVTSITFSGLTAGKGYSLMIDIKQDATGARAVTLPASFKAISGSDTAVQAAANAKTKLIISTTDGGTTWAYSMKLVAA